MRSMSWRLPRVAAVLSFAVGALLLWRFLAPASPTWSPAPAAVCAPEAVGDRFVIFLGLRKNRATGSFANGGEHYLLTALAQAVEANGFRVEYLSARNARSKRGDPFDPHRLRAAHRVIAFEVCARSERARARARALPRLARRNVRAL